MCEGANNHKVERHFLPTATLTSLSDEHAAASELNYLKPPLLLIITIVPESSESKSRMWEFWIH